jgi:O-succinylbenzoic acid--CoA ligase
VETSDTLLPNWLARCARNTPSHLALTCGAVRWSFADLDREATQLALRLVSLGVRADSRVAVLAANSVGYAVLIHALTRVGAVLVPLNVRLTQDELCWQLRDVHAEFLIHDVQYAAVATAVGTRLPELQCATLADAASGDEVVLARLPAADVPLRTLINLSDTHVIMYTSGTTGNPKGVVITYGMQWWNAVGSALNLGHYPDDRWLVCTPLFHTSGLCVLIRSVINGIGVVLHKKFDPAEVNRSIREEQVSIISVVTVMLQRMLSDLVANGIPTYPATLRCVLLGGGPAPQPLLEECARHTIPVVQSYGLTESCSQAVTLAPADALRKLGSAGRPLLPVQLRIVHDEHEAAPGEAGVILLKGPTITPGYDGRPEVNAATFQNGWFSTGDLGYLDADGYLYVLDRRSDLIISGGENVYPAEIEAVLLAHPAVEEAGVCGVEDMQWGQVPVAFVHVREGYSTSAKALLAYVQQRLARYKLPRALYFVAPLPRTSSGKLMRRELSRLLPVQS